MYMLSYLFTHHIYTLYYDIIMYYVLPSYEPLIKRYCKFEFFNLYILLIMCRSLIAVQFDVIILLVNLFVAYFSDFFRGSVSRRYKMAEL